MFTLSLCCACAVACCRNFSRGHLQFAELSRRADQHASGEVRTSQAKIRESILPLKADVLAIQEMGTCQRVC
jgi:hypothetical protein